MTARPSGEGMYGQTYGKKFRADHPLGKVNDRIQFFKEMLNKHKEGIVIYYWGNNQHAVLLTDYDSTTNTFYCADPANATAQGIDVENIAKETEMSVYPDSSQVSDWAADAMRYCIASKVINGDGNGNILPKNYASRAEMATIIVRFIQE